MSTATLPLATAGGATHRLEARSPGVAAVRLGSAVMTSGTGGLLVPVLSAALLELPLAALLVHRAARAVSGQQAGTAGREGAAVEG